jgi:hypothetical protein
MCTGLLHNSVGEARYAEGDLRMFQAAVVPTFCAEEFVHTALAGDVLGGNLPELIEDGRLAVVLVHRRPDVLVGVTGGVCGANPEPGVGREEKFGSDVEVVGRGHEGVREGEELGVAADQGRLI